MSSESCMLSSLSYKISCFLYTHLVVFHCFICFKGEQSNAWYKADITLETGITMATFKAVRGSHYAGDIAIDDISIVKGSCSQSPVVPEPEDTAAIPDAEISKPELAKIDMECSFDAGDFCDMFSQAHVIDDRDWLMLNNDTDSSDTGPAADHTTGISGRGGYSQ